jgi:hypothetical protein
VLASVSECVLETIATRGGCLSKSILRDEGEGELRLAQPEAFPLFERDDQRSWDDPHCINFSTASLFERFFAVLLLQSVSPTERVETLESQRRTKKNFALLVKRLA